MGSEGNEDEDDGDEKGGGHPGHSQVHAVELHPT